MGSLETQNVLPIVDFTKDTLKPGTSCWVSTSKEVVQALQEYGCFIALYDKVSTELRKDVVGSLREFFDRPSETKAKFTNSDKPYLGYLGPAPTRPLYESIGFNATSIDAIARFGQQVFPSQNQHFSGIMHSHAKQVAELEQMVIKMVFESYGVDKLSESHIDSTSYLLRLMKYGVPKKDETNLGIHCHTDKSFTSILHQNQVNGLDVQTKAGDWISVKFQPSSFIVMAGDPFIVWSNDRVRACAHRVIISGNEERHSLGIFAFLNGLINTPDELVDDEHPRLHEAYDHFGLLESYVKNIN